MPLYRVTLTQLMYSQTIQNVIHLATDNAVELLTVANSVNANWVETVRQCQVNDLKYVDIKVQDALTPANAPAHLTIDKNGVLFGFNLSFSYVAVLLRLLTNVAGRAGRGRIYIAGYESGQHGQNNLGTNAINLWNNKLAILKGQYVGQTPSTGMNLAVAPRTNPANWKEVVDVQVRTQMASQRRRNSGVGI
jgi:hypothetical protein